jgi:hypothetical protein
MEGHAYKKPSAPSTTANVNSHFVNCGTTDFLERDKMCAGKHKGDILHGRGYFESGWVIGRSGPIRARLFARHDRASSAAAHNPRPGQDLRPMAQMRSSAER